MVDIAVAVGRTSLGGRATNIRAANSSRYLDAYTCGKLDRHAAAVNRNIDAEALDDCTSSNLDRHGPATACHTHGPCPSTADEHRISYTIAHSHGYRRAGGKRHAF